MFAEVPVNSPGGGLLPWVSSNINKMREDPISIPKAEYGILSWFSPNIVFWGNGNMAQSQKEQKWEPNTQISSTKRTRNQ